MKLAMLSLLLFTSYSGYSGVFAAPRPAKIKFCSNIEDSFPWVFSDHDGVSILAVKEISKRLGIEAEISLLPWKRCLSDIEKGEMDSAIGASYKEDRAVYSEYPMKDNKHDSTRRLFTETYSLYKMIGSPVSFDGTKISNLTKPIGVQFSFSIGDRLKKEGYVIDDGARSTADNFKKLLAGRVDAVALQHESAAMNIKKNKELDGKIERIQPDLEVKPYYILFSKNFYGKNKEFVEQFWNETAKFRESPEFKKIMEEEFNRNK